MGDAELNRLKEGVLRGERAALARGITLVESRQPKYRKPAQELLQACTVAETESFRLGITGVPGVGKSTFIEQLGLFLIEECGYKVAVLAVDPSSSVGKGSILGDKTRMQELSRNENAFIRPSPSGTTLGGVNHRTRESILLCEASGYDFIIVETMGVGQGEFVVHSMVDFFLLLKVTGTGDELQGIKRGIVELADAIVFNKADGDNLPRAEQARVEWQRVLELSTQRKPNRWKPPVLCCSSLSQRSVAGVWDTIRDFWSLAESNGSFAEKRSSQLKSWFYQTLEEGLRACFFEKESVRRDINECEQRVMANKALPHQAAEELLTRHLPDLTVKKA